MKLLITGICGFVGSRLATELQEQSPSLTLYGIDNLMRPGSERNRLPLQKRGITVIHGDVRNRSDLEMLPEVDIILDASANPSILAGVGARSSSFQLIEHNLLGTVNLLELCRKRQSGFILLSSSRVYSIKPLAELAVTVYNNAFRLPLDVPLLHGISNLGVTESFSTTPPVSLYGSTKLASEILALEYGEAFDFPVWINRCGVLAGAGQFGTADQGIFSYWINAYLRRKPLRYIGFDGNGYQVRDMLHPRDLVPLILQQMTLPASEPKPRILNLGGGVQNAMSLANLSEWCADRFGRHDVIRDGQPRKYDIPWFIMDSSLAHASWSWKPQTTMDEILAEIAEHAESNPEWLNISGAI